MPDPVRTADRHRADDRLGSSSVPATLVGGLLVLCFGVWILSMSLSVGPWFALVASLVLGLVAWRVPIDRPARAVRLLVAGLAAAGVLLSVLHLLVDLLG